MKSFLAIFLFVFSFNASATCIDEVWANYEWANDPAMNTDIKNCIVNSPTFQEALSRMLCTQNQSTISDEYKSYLGYKADYIATEIERDEAQSESRRRALNQKLNGIQTDWEIYGFKFEMDIEESLAFQSGRDCFLSHTAE